MPLLRTMARTAVIAGTATRTSNRVNRRQQGRWADQEQNQMAAAPAPVAPAAPASSEDRMEQLKQLGQLHESGVLTDEEFASEKAKLLG
jgi:Short C-terminal domain